MTRYKGGLKVGVNSGQTLSGVAAVLLLSSDAYCAARRCYPKAYGGERSLRGVLVSFGPPSKDFRPSLEVTLVSIQGAFQSCQPLVFLLPNALFAVRPDLRRIVPRVSLLGISSTYRLVVAIPIIPLVAVIIVGPLL